MVTASHNPPAGQRLQGLPRRRLQIVAAGRREISAHIADVTALGRGRGPAARRGLGDPRRRHRRRLRRAGRDPGRGGPALARPGRLHGDARSRAARSSCRRPGGAPASPSPSSSTEQFEPGSAPSRPSAFPNPEEPGAMDLAFATAAGGRRRHRHRERPGRRPLRGGRADAGAAGACSPATRSGSLLGWWIAVGNRRVVRPACLRRVDRLRLPAGADRGRRGPRLRADADRLQVDRPRAAT